MLFEAERLHFFRPLTGKYREQIAGCLRELYARLYTSLADYSRVIGRELVLEVFQEAITRTPVLDDAHVAQLDDIHAQLVARLGKRLVEKYGLRICRFRITPGNPHVRPQGPGITLTGALFPLWEHSQRAHPGENSIVRDERIGVDCDRARRLHGVG